MVAARVFILMAACIWVFAGLGQSALALGKHTPHQPRAQRPAKKNTSPYAYLAPKKQKKPKGWYQSTLTGELVYGKPKR